MEASAASITSGRNTIPGPPPKGGASTERCLSPANARMSSDFSDQIPVCNAFPARDCPKGPGNISGKRVKTVAAQGLLHPFAFIIKVTHPFQELLLHLNRLHCYPLNLKLVL